MNTTILDNVTLDLKVKRSINYAKARAAIDMAATCRDEKRQAKATVIEYLGGKVVREEKGRITVKTVVFPDQSQARY